MKSRGKSASTGREHHYGITARVSAAVNSMRVSTKAILLSIALITLVISAAFITLSIEIRKETKRILRDTLNLTEQQVLSIKEDNLSQLLWVSSQITSNPTLRAAMETYRLESAMNVTNRDELVATLKNELDKIWPGLRHDLLILTDEKGLALAVNGDVTPEPIIGTDFSGLPVLRHALDPAATASEHNSGVITLQGRHYLIGSLPIELQGYIIGTLTLGDLIDSSFLPNLRAFFGGEIVVTEGHRTIASTLAPNASGGSDAEALAGQGTSVIRDDGTARLGDEEYLVTAMSLGSNDSGDTVTLFLLRSLTQAMQQPNRNLKNTLATQAALAILLGALLTWVAARTSLRPLEKFVTFMKVVAETGDYSLRFGGRKTPGGNPPDEQTDPNPEARVGINSHNELDLLADGFNQMLTVIETRDTSLRNARTRLEESIVALQEKEVEVRQLQKIEAIGLLAGSVAHDFNNILMVVSGFSELALRSLDSGHEARSCIEEVQKASKSASMLTRQLLAFSSKQVIAPQVINLNMVIGGLENMLQRAVGESIALTLHLDPGLQNVLADPAQIEQVLLNLLLNSRDAIVGAGQITIETANAAPGEDPETDEDLALEIPHVMIAVRDSGCGIDDEIQGRMFDPFFTTKDKGKGTGLGLSTVRRIVNQCGGQIRVESKPGQGTVFTIYLPSVMSEVEPAPASSKRSHGSGSAVILVVEDEPNVRQVVREMLSTGGYSVLEAPGPAEALRLFEECGGQIDLLLTDVMMPLMNGRQLRDKIAATKPGIKTVFISGYADGVMDELGILPDGANFLQKPFTPEALVAKVQHMLDQGESPI